MLYDLCKGNFEHKIDEHILTKVLFIGRIYAAAVERRRNKSTEINDNFYINVIVPTFKKSKLDEMLSELKSIKSFNTDGIIRALRTHSYMTKMLQTITELEKRSFSSKYLHFHNPDAFYIYDSRVVNALRQFSFQISPDLKLVQEYNKIDKEYAKFYCKCVELKRLIKNKYNILLTNRQLDRLLIVVANKQNIEKLKTNR